jgi:hypothetical protein
MGLSNVCFKFMPASGCFVIDWEPKHSELNKVMMCIGCCYDRASAGKKGILGPIFGEAERQVIC